MLHPGDTLNPAGFGFSATQGDLPYNRIISVFVEYGDSKIAGTDIYQSVGFSAAHIMYIIRALLDKYDIDRSDFVYSARSTKATSTEVE